MTDELDARAASAYRQGLECHQIGRFEEAAAHYRRALQLQPRYADAWHMLGVLAIQDNKPDQGVDLIGRALLIEPRSAAAHLNQGIAWTRLGRFDHAIASYDAAIALQPNRPDAYFSRGNALRESRRYAEAVASYDAAIALRPDHAESLLNRGLVWAALDDHRAALMNFDGAIAAKPGFAPAHFARGVSLSALGSHAEALAGFDAAIALRPDHALSYLSRGVNLNFLKQHEAALASLDQAIALEPGHADAHFHRGNALHELKRYAAAVDSYDRAIALGSIAERLRGLRLHAMLQMCQWGGIDAGIAELAAGIERGAAVEHPFHVLFLTDSAALQKKAAELWIESTLRPDGALPALQKRERRGKLRIGYFSSDFHSHATPFLMAGLFESHDRDRFEPILLSFGPDSRDAMRQRLTAACQFIDVRGKTDREIAQFARDLQIDIAVDLKGLTDGGRPGIFAQRAAPLQVAYLGYPGTTGARHMDYLVADRTLVPPDQRHHYCEKIICLPNSYQVNDRKRVISATSFARPALGLPATGFVFCSFGVSCKITPRRFASWMRMLVQVEDSVLWLLEDNPEASRNLRAEATRWTVVPDRLVFASRLPPAEHLARHRAADLFLDTLPCNAHTTASDALWAGLPVLTCAGEGFAGRVAASLLTAVGLPELITPSEQEYETLAVALAQDPRRLQALKQRLAVNRLVQPLFDTALFTRHLEAAYAAIEARHQADLPPEHLDVHSEG